MRQLAGQVAIVTGAARGIGRAIAVALASEGAILSACDIDQTELAGLAAELQALSPLSIAVQLDVASVSSVRSFVQSVFDSHGRIDILINNAAVTRPQDLLDVAESEFDWISGVNFKGAFFMLQSVAAHMQTALAGKIVNIASIAGKGYAKTTNIVYAGSKGALIAMTRVAAARLGPYGVTVNALCPGMTETEMMLGWLETRAAEAGLDMAAMKKQLCTDVALQRTNSVQDIANGVLFWFRPLRATSPDSR